jgi:hypothetical protein
MHRSSSGQGHRPFTAKIMGSNPIRCTIFERIGGMDTTLLITGGTEPLVCSNMVAIPEAAIPTDRDRIGVSSPQRMTPY